MKYQLWLFFVLNISAFINTSFGLFDNFIINGALDKLGFEQCNNYFIPSDWEGLKESIKTKIFGQPFLASNLIPFLKVHKADEYKSMKPLVLSFHGSPGTGKNYVSTLIAQHMYKKGMNSKYIHYFNGRMHFTRFALIDEYKEDLQSWIKGNITDCGRSLFIFDELDSINPSVINAIKPFLDYGQLSVTGVDMSQSIFIFLSNTGMELINNQSMNLWKNGIEREHFELLSFQGLIEDVYGSQGWLTYLWKKVTGGFRESSLIESLLIDIMVPFLPLEKSHIKKCIKHLANQMNRKVTERHIEKIILLLDFEPEDIELFARHGCKNIHMPTVSVLQKELKDEL